MKTFSIRNIATLAAGSALVATFVLSGTALAAATAPTVSPTGSGYGHRMGGSNMPRPTVVGTVASISGDTLTVTAKAWAKPGSTTTAAPAATTYTVDATNATVTKDGTASTLSAIATGDTVMVQGTASGTSVAATAIRDLPAQAGGMPQGMTGKKGGSGSTTARTPIITGNGEPVVGGSVTAISGDTLTVTNTSNVTYSVDATNASVTKMVTTTALSNVATGDQVVVQGTVNGTAVTASSVIDQGAAPSATGTVGAKKPQGGFMGAIGGFFTHLFGFF
jgi:hypothetical protein